MVVLVSCTSDSGSSGSDPETVELSETAWRKGACALPADWLNRIDHGTETGGGRGSDLVVVPNPEHYIGDVINTSHSGPYDHLQEIPLLFYGPGYIKEAQQITDPVTLTSVAPTTARLIGFDLTDVDAPPLESALVEDVVAPPPLVVTIVIDGGGTNVFEYWSESWPNLKRLMAEGTSYVNATVGSSPSITPASHTTIGTGVYPRRHGVTAISIRKYGEIVGAFTRGPRDEDALVNPRISLSHPTLAELYDQAKGNEPIVALLGFGSWVTGMVGRGSIFGDGDRDIVGYFELDQWITKKPFYTLPDYLLGPNKGVEREIERADALDGELDGKWRSQKLNESLLPTPAFSPIMERAISALVKNEGMGADEVPDLLYANLKTPDSAGHLWNMTAPEQKAAIESVDEAIGGLVSSINEEVGEGNWVLVVTADHGQTPLEGDQWPISGAEMRADVDAALDHVDNGRGLFDTLSNTTLFLNRYELKANDLSPEHVASFLSAYTLEENVADGELPEKWADAKDDLLYPVAFPVSRLDEVKACVLGR